MSPHALDAAASGAQSGAGRVLAMDRKRMLNGFKAAARSPMTVSGSYGYHPGISAKIIAAFYLVCEKDRMLVRWPHRLLMNIPVLWDQCNRRFVYGGRHPHLLPTTESTPDKI